MEILSESYRMLFRRRPMYISASSKSIQGELHAVDGVENQDSSFISLQPSRGAYKNFRSNLRGCKPRAAGLYAFGVFDGHGPQGEFVSALAAQRMKDAVERLMVPSQHLDLVQVAKQAFSEVACTINGSNYSSDSGTTGSIVLIRDDDLVFANVGDSSALLMSRAGLVSKKRARHMTPVHRAADENEANRIRAMGGFIREGYVVDEQAKNGIGITRTLGDCDMHQYGCISDPSIRHLKLRKRDIAIIIASDGLWDVPGMTSKDVLDVTVTKQKRRAKSICKSLLQIAREREGPSDDCTIVCIRLD